MKTKEELLKIYSAYLPYGLECLIQGHHNQDGNPIKEKLLGIYDGTEVFTSLGLKDYQTNEIEDILPILYSIDMLTKEITHNGETFVPIDYISTSVSNKQRILRRVANNQNLDCLEQWQFERLLKLNFNVFNLPESAYIKKENLKY